MGAHTLLQPMKTLCSTCSLRELCLPVGLRPDEFEQLDTVIKQSHRLKKGEFLFRSGESFHSLYAIRTGFFKTTVASQDGRDQVTGFFMSGELIGMDGICTHSHSCDAVALEDSEVCELPFGHMEALSKEIPSIQTHFFRLMSREIVRDQGVMLLLGNMRAEERIAAFLLNLSQRLLETVSRTLSRFHQEGLIVVEHKHIRLLKPELLNQMVSGGSHAV